MKYQVILSEKKKKMKNFFRLLSAAVVIGISRVSIIQGLETKNLKFCRRKFVFCFCGALRIKVPSYLNGLTKEVLLPGSCICFYEAV